MSASTRDIGEDSQTGNLPSVDELIQRIVKRLEVNPKDVEGWRMLGWSYTGMERFKESADAYGKAIELAPDQAELRSALAEALIRRDDNRVTPEAVAIIEGALKRDPTETRARYYLGLSKEQRGDKAGALADWKQLVADSDPNEPFIVELKRKLMLLGAEPAAGDPAQPGAPAASSGRVDKGPTMRDVKAAEAMAPGDRMAMIHRMVDSLAARLQQAPHDAEGWIKLVRSYAVLKDGRKAKDALASALKIFEGDPEARERIVAAARDADVAR